MPENNNLYKKVAGRGDRESPPPGSIPREEQRHLSRSSSHMSCEGEGHFIPEEGVSSDATNVRSPLSQCQNCCARASASLQGFIVQTERKCRRFDQNSRV